jgi:putative hydrolase of the HAD superfamily
VIVYKPIGDIRSLSFDLDDTFYTNWPYIVEAEQHLRAHIKAQYAVAANFSGDDWHEFKRQALQVDPGLYSDMGELRRQTLHIAFKAANMARNKIDHAVNDCFDVFYHKRSDFNVDKQVHTVLSTLANKVPLVAITNGNVNCQQIGIAHYFSHILQANKHQRMKPHRDMFAAASALLDLPPRQILHVGDNLEKDVWGATRAGMQSAWFAYDRNMVLGTEKALTLPHIQLNSLDELPLLLKQM